MTVSSQNEIQIQGFLNIESNTILIKQKITYYNNSNSSLSQLYFNDWGSSFSNPDSPLSKRFVEEYDGSLLNPRKKNRGFTTIHSVENEKQKALSYSYIENQCDLFKIELTTDLLPFTSTTIFIEYTLQIQSDRFTKYGVTKNGDYFLNYWYITPAVFEDSEWKLFSNKNLDDYYTPKSKLKLTLEIPHNYSASSELNLNNVVNKSNTHVFTFEGSDRVDTRLNISTAPFFKFKIGDLNIISNNIDADESLNQQINSFKKIVGFLNDRLGVYPHENLMISKVDLKKHPIYGLNLLPGFLSPFSKEFEYELTVAKNLIRLYLDQYLRMNPREDYWLKSGLETVLLMDFVDVFYKDQMMLGKLANMWGIKTYNLAKLKYNEQYQLTYLYMVRTGRDQALNLHKDELLKFNANLSTKYKAAKGLIFLEDLMEGSRIEDWIKEFVVETKNEFKTTNDFESYIKTKTNKDLSWFFESFITNTQQIDYKITKLKSTKDSVYFTIKNNKKGQTPVSLFTLKNGKVLTKTWLTGIGKKKDFVVANNLADKYVLNYDQKVPEFNVKNNWKSVKGSALFNRPFKLRLIKDYVSPYNNQLYFLPTLEYRNIYDGLNLGLNINNSGILKKPFTFGVAPNYSVNSKTLTGFTKFEYNTYFQDQNLYNIEFGLFMSRSSFAEDSFVRRTLPYLSFNFKDATNLRSNKFESLNLRYVGIDKDYVETFGNEMALPSYGVFNIRYLNSDIGYKKHYSWFLDTQFSNEFGKVAFNYEIRKRTNKNSFYNLRLFAGSFLYSKIDTNQTYFDFALDRPTDYLFEYNYLGQFESSGIFSQQIIIADGGFKSRLETYYANQWITTLNASASIWKYVQTYGDVGFIKNKGKGAEFVYDSGIRLNLITNYFEIFFPVYSNLGWEIATPEYSQKIRFIFTADPTALFGLFRREWF
tara:strand:- start:2431 stop:5220 length:2790 start_codon:yes stop_codon:yes gene_type:complete